MKRLAAVCFLLLSFIMITGLSQTAMNPQDFTGQWYSDDQTAYLFQDGLIYSEKHMVSLSDATSISGAYTYCKNSIFLFVEGIEGLETEKELYLVQKGDGSFLCENKDGSGRIYLIRYHQ